MQKLLCLKDPDTYPMRIVGFHIDASILTDHMMLQATELGLGTVWVCFFKPDVIKKEFQLPDNLEPINILAIGYGKGIAEDSERHSETRIPMEELVSYDYL